VRPRETGVAHGENLALHVVHRKRQGHKAVVQPRLAQVFVHVSQHFRRLAGMLDHMRAQHADGQRAVERRRRRLAGDVAHRNRQLVAGIKQEIVEVAAQLPRRRVGIAEVEPRQARRRCGQQTFLDFARRVEVAL
jgi:hypothetical protein